MEEKAWRTTSWRSARASARLGELYNEAEFAADPSMMVATQFRRFARRVLRQNPGCLD
jgi:hypothetical protein